MVNDVNLTDVFYVTDGIIRRADIRVENGIIVHIRDKEEMMSSSQGAASGAIPDSISSLLLPGIIDEHIHSREPGLTRKGDLSTETHAAAAGGVTSVMDMPNVLPQTTTLDAFEERCRMGAAHAFVNYAFHFGATNTNASLLPLLDPVRVPSVKLFMGSSTGGMLVDHGEALRNVFTQSPILIMTHCEDSAIINANMRAAQVRYGDDLEVSHHPEIRSREACLASTRQAVQLARETGARLLIAHVTTTEELNLIASCPDTAGIFLEVCLPHLLFCDEDYATAGTRIKCNPAVKTRADRDALRRALMEGSITTIATDHAPHLWSEKQGGCCTAASGMPMVQFSLVAMMELVEDGVLSIGRLVELMCHQPARLFEMHNRGYIREGMKADMTVINRAPWVLTPEQIVSRCGWSPLEGHTFRWQVAQTYCNGRLIYQEGVFADGNQHAEALSFRC